MSLSSLAAAVVRDTLQTRVRTSSSGFPYIHQAAWVRFRDWVPHILADGPAVLATVDDAVAAAGTAHAHNAAAVGRVLQQIVQTASITAPPDLWLLRAIVAALHEVGVAQRLLADEVVTPATTTTTDLLEHELQVDLRFLLARGLVVRIGGGYRLADTDAARAVLAMGPMSWSVDTATGQWLEAFADHRAMPEAVAAALSPLPSSTREPGHWAPTAADVELGARLVPMVLALQVRRQQLGDTLETPRPPAADHLFAAAGLLDPSTSTRLSPLGERVATRGPGPFGIIEAYRGYLAQLPRIWREGRGQVWVERTANVAASQVANQKTFTQANDALDAFCRDTGFSYDVFIEHAVGKGEATRQRFQRSGAAVRYVGADLEDAAIDAALLERDAGALPTGMHFVRNADIGKPRSLLDGLASAQLAAEGAVMMVGNGFHEVRGQNDEAMIEVFRGYERAGIVVIFTEETGLAIDDLLATAWNTYHAGFKYVHERSGQGLRPAEARPASPLEGPLPKSWSECAEAAGYVRAERWCRRGRTVYPYPPPSGHNPSISVNHFFVPGRIAARLGLS